MSVDHINKAEAVAAVERCKFHDENDDRHIVHCFAGPFGADWNAESVIADIEAADDVAWIDHLLWGRCLATKTDGQTRVFDTVTPEEVTR